MNERLLEDILEWVQKPVAYVESERIVRSENRIEVHDFDGSGLRMELSRYHRGWGVGCRLVFHRDGAEYQSLTVLELVIGPGDECSDALQVAWKTALYEWGQRKTAESNDMAAMLSHSLVEHLRRERNHDADAGQPS